MEEDFEVTELNNGSVYISNSRSSLLFSEEKAMELARELNSLFALRKRRQEEETHKHPA